LKNEEELNELSETVKEFKLTETKGLGTEKKAKEEN